MKKDIKKRLQYFWDYEKWKVIIPVVTVILIVSLVRTFFQEKKDPLLCLAVVNCSAEGRENAADFFVEFEGTLESRAEDAEMEIDSSFVHPKEDDAVASADSAAVASVQKYQAILTCKRLDVTISTDWAVEIYEQSGCYEDLSKLLTEEQMENWKEKLFYCKNDEGENVPVGLYLDGVKELDEWYPEQPPILTVSTLSTRKDISLAFIEWIMEKDDTN